MKKALEVLAPMQPYVKVYNFLTRQMRMKLTRLVMGVLTPQTVLHQNLPTATRTIIKGTVRRGTRATLRMILVVAMAVMVSAGRWAQHLRLPPPIGDQTDKLTWSNSVLGPTQRIRGPGDSVNSSPVGTIEKMSQGL